jgi:hypothetical protein
MTQHDRLNTQSTIQSGPVVGEINKIIFSNSKTTRQQMIQAEEALAVV